jgi:ribosomal protein S18 acetylase RimI-like enzyme
MNQIETKFVYTEVNTTEDVEKLITFFLSGRAFDAVLTPGEREQIYREPFMSLRSRDIKYWYSSNKKGDIIAAIGVKETEHKTSGYCISFIAVDESYRHHGIGKSLIAIAVEFVKSNEGRFLIVDTSDKHEYVAMRNLLVKMGFTLVGNFPEYYHKGESTLWYYIKTEA